MQRIRAFLKSWSKAIILSFLIVLLFVGFIGNWFVVTSGSMENALLTGDFVFVNKYSYGARLPMTPLSIPFTNKYSKLISLDYNRLPGLTEVKRNDIVAFNYPDLDTLVPVDHKSVWIKRVVALPGEKINFRNGDVYINSVYQEPPGTLKFNHLIQLNGDEAAFFYKYDINEASRVSTHNDWLIAMTSDQASEVKHYNGVKFLRREMRRPNEYEEEVYPYELGFGWNEDHYGPVEVPKKGGTIKLTTENIALYRLCIKAYEKNELVEFGNKFYLNGKHITEYTFKMNYYFVAGDNRHNSSDSRYWGFLPEDHLIGKVSRVFFSVDKSDREMRWARIFSSVN